MEQTLIRADKRDVKGKGVARKLRKDGKIPAVLYGRGLEAVSITVLSRDWEKLGKQTRRNVIFNMELHGDKDVENRPVMVKEIQKGFLGGKVLHIDFLQVSMERMIEVEIPIHLKGKSKGEVNGGIVEVHLRSMRVECLPTQIPEEIAVDISDLEIGDSFHVNQISIPGVKLLESAGVAIVTIIPPAVEEKVVVEEAAAIEPEEGKAEDKKEDKKEIEVSLYLLCGLGNKDFQYALTRHNIGYLVIDRFSERFNIPVNKKQSGCRIGVREDLVLAKPDTYMNLSGGPLSQLIKKKNVALADLIVIHDDLDMEFGKVRIRWDGRDGGHKGVRSIIERTGSNQFHRLKIGIGRNPSMASEEYVLKRFQKEELPVLNEALDTAVDALDTFIREGSAKAMSMFNKRGQI